MTKRRMTERETLRGRNGRVLESLIALALLAAGGCASTPVPRTGAPSLPPVTVEHVEEKALLLLLSDRETYEPVSFNRAIDGNVDLRRRAALALARIGDARGGPPLELLLSDPEPEVRRAAAFALGELGELSYPQGASALLGALLDRDRETGTLAAEALAKLGVELSSVTQRLAALDEEERLPRLLPSLFRFQTGAGREADLHVVEWAERGLESSDSRLHALAAYALSREAKPAAVPALRTLLGDGDPWVRGWAVRALGRVGDRSDVERLRPLLDDEQPGPIIQTLRALPVLLADGKAAPPADWKPRLLELLADPRPGVRLTAIEASALWLLDEELSDALARFVGQGHPRERELAFLALAEGEDPRAAGVLLSMSRDSDPVLRARAAEVAGLFHSEDVLDRLEDDDDPRVRRAIFETRVTLEPDAAVQLALAALEDEDAALRASALAWAEEHPELPLEALRAAWSAARRDRIDEARLAVVRALAARARAVPEERGMIVAELEERARDTEFLVRRQAVQELAELGQDPPAVGPADRRRSVQTFREIVLQTSAPRRAEIVTESGTVTVELACLEAPLTCLNFLQLAAQGYYDGLTFHRVVPDFVVQGGDPRGDGAGGPGYSIRDEMNLLRYRRGVMGMALSGPDTGGSQFFITLSPQPHLDGGYTAFGRVVAGDEVLDQIVQGDRILRIVEAPSGTPARRVSTATSRSDR